eukprot:SRR837773.12408.p4 GENE.SRR837773.12408~~SRR837773.12408.p4  ORF type:complete len:119 (-),score=16.95 SRR837773.12408:193-549(-)
MLVRWHRNEVSGDGLDAIHPDRELTDAGQGDVQLVAASEAARVPRAVDKLHAIPDIALATNCKALGHIRGEVQAFASSMKLCQLPWTSSSHAHPEARCEVLCIHATHDEAEAPAAIGL